MNPSVKRFTRVYVPIADAIASADIGQCDRERVASAVADALAGRADFARDAFALLASDPLVPCAGPRGTDGPCPHGRVIRTAMHDRSAPDGRSPLWAQRAPYGEVRCVTCGAPS